MENYKIYRQENYIKISGKQDWYGLVKDVFVDKSNVKKAEYRFFNVKDWKSNIALSIGQIQKEDGSFYTEQEFDTFYRENTGNFKSPNSGAIFVEVATLPVIDINQNIIYILPDNSWNVYNGVQWIKEDIQNIIYTEVATLPTTNIKTNIIYILPNGSWNLYNGINWLKEDVQFVVVDNYSALPLAPTNNKWFWVSNSQGISWLPGFLGGTYYPKGVYYYNGVSYEYVETPYQASQVEVDAGINNDKFVTPLTLKNSTQWDTKLNVVDLPSNLVLYPTTATSDIATYYKLVTDIHDVDYNTTALDVNTGIITTTTQLISSLSTEASLIIGNPGVFNITVVGNIRKISGSGDADFYFQVYKRDNVGIETLIATSSNTPTVTSSVYEQFNATALWDDGVFTTTDRIVLKFYANRIAGSSDPEYQFQFGGAAPVRALVPVPLSTIGYTKTEVDTLLDAKQDILTIDVLPIDGSTNTISSNAVFDALALKANTDAPILYHVARWFTPTSTVSNVGATVTSVGTQFTSLMVGSKLTINGEQRLITGFTSSTVVTVNSPYSVNNTGIVAANWGVFSKAYENPSGFSRFIDQTGVLVFRTAAGNNVEISNGLSSGTNAGFFSDNFTVRSDYRYLFSSTSSAFGIKDLGFRRNSAGILEIYDGVTATGLLANRRDLLVRNVNASQYNISALNTAPASATATGTLGEIRYTADFIYICIATNTWVRTALTTW